jgi:endogenous inhibitor of DNA gyrase (YacG/DUF329 family)
MTLKERLIENEYASRTCSYCGSNIDLNSEIVTDIDFFDNGTYCSKKCLSDDHIQVFKWAAEQ